MAGVRRLFGAARAGLAPAARGAPEVPRALLDATGRAVDEVDTALTRGLPLLISPRVHELLEVQEVFESETDLSMKERLDLLAEQLEQAGVRDEVIEAALNMEWFIGDLIAQWQEEMTRLGRQQPLAAWASRLMNVTDFTLIKELESMEVQVRAMSRLAGLSYEEATEIICRTWFTSLPPTAGEPSQNPTPERLAQEHSSPALDSHLEPSQYVALTN